MDDILPDADLVIARSPGGDLHEDTTPSHADPVKVTTTTTGVQGMAAPRELPGELTHLPGHSAPPDCPSPSQGDPSSDLVAHAHSLVSDHTHDGDRNSSDHFALQQQQPEQQPGQGHGSVDAPTTIHAGSDPPSTTSAAGVDSSNPARNCGGVAAQTASPPQLPELSPELMARFFAVEHMVHSPSYDSPLMIPPSTAATRDSNNSHHHQQQMSYADNIDMPHFMRSLHDSAGTDVGEEEGRGSHGMPANDAGAADVRDNSVHNFVPHPHYPHNSHDSTDSVEHALPVAMPNTTTTAGDHTARAQLSTRDLHAETLQQGTQQPLPHSPYQNNNNSINTDTTTTQGAAARPHHHHVAHPPAPPPTFTPAQVPDEMEEIRRALVATRDSSSSTPVHASGSPLVFSPATRQLLTGNNTNTNNAGGEFFLASRSSQQQQAQFHAPPQQHGQRGTYDTTHSNNNNGYSYTMPAGVPQQHAWDVLPQSTQQPAPIHMQQYHAFASSPSSHFPTPHGVRVMAGGAPFHHIGPQQQQQYAFQASSSAAYSTVGCPVCFLFNPSLLMLC